MKRLIVIVGLILIVSSAAFWYFSTRLQSPKFIKITNCRFSEISEEQIATCLAEVVLYNPNQYNAKLVYTDINVFSNDLKVATISLTSVTNIPANQVFSLPLSCKINLLNVIGAQGLSGLLEKALSSEKKIPLKFEGHCRLVIDHNVYRIPISAEENIVFK
jgi:LEA14-like dessication related protein